MLTVSKSSAEYKKRNQNFLLRDRETSDTRYEEINTLTHRRNEKEAKEWQRSKT